MYVEGGACGKRTCAPQHTHPLGAYCQYMRDAHVQYARCTGQTPTSKDCQRDLTTDIPGVLPVSIDRHKWCTAYVQHVCGTADPKKDVDVSGHVEGGMLEPGITHVGVTACKHACMQCDIRDAVLWPDG